MDAPKPEFNAPEEVQRALSSDAVLWIVAANRVTGSLSTAISLPVMRQCFDCGLIEPTGQMARWKLSAAGWSVRKLMLRE